MVSTFCIAQLPIQINYPKELKKPISHLVVPYLSSKKSQFRANVKLNDAGYKIDRLKATQAQKRLLSTIDINREFSTIEIKTRAIEAVSAAIGLFLVIALAERHGILLHGAYLRRDGLAYIFLGKSGAGKSTIARNASDAEVVHDDRLVVRKIKDRWWAFGVPLCDNANNTGKNIEAPLAGVYLIDKSYHLLATQLRAKPSLEGVAESMILPIKNVIIAKACLQTLIDFVSENKCYWLQFAKDSNVVNII